MPRRLPMYCVEDPDRHGNIRIYLKRRGHRKVRLRGTPWTPDFMVAYEAALSGRPLPCVASVSDAETGRSPAITPSTARGDGWCASTPRAPGIE